MTPHGGGKCLDSGSIALTLLLLSMLNSIAADPYLCDRAIANRKYSIEGRHAQALVSYDAAGTIQIDRQLRHKLVRSITAVS
jgi:hypothetical protein